MKLAKIFLAIIALVVVSCKPDPNPVNPGGGNTDQTKWEKSGDIVGSWELTSWSESTTAKPRVYISLYDDGTFDLYQQAYTIEWVLYTGDYTLSNSVLSGVYADGKAWGNTYEVDFAENPTRMRLQSIGNSVNVSIYTQTAIPAEVVESAKRIEPNTRSEVIERFL